MSDRFMFLGIGLWIAGVALLVTGYPFWSLAVLMASSFAIAFAQCDI